MRRLSFRPTVVPLAVAVGALAFAACSDSPTGPTRSLRSSDANLSVSAGPGANQITIVSDAGVTNPTQFCSGSTKLGVFDEAVAFPATAPALSGCANARDLQADGSLTAYNPGWDNPNGLTTTTGHWVGFTAGTALNNGPSSDYRPTPGLYYYSQTFTLPAGATAAANPTLTLQVMADNVAAVYLNGTKLGSQYYKDCNNRIGFPAVQVCNWTNATSASLPGGRLTVTAGSALLNAPGVPNTLVFIVADVPTGYDSNLSGVGGSSPNYGCTTRPFQVNGQAGFGGAPVATASGHVGPHPTGEAAGMFPTPTVNTPNPTQDGCENPSGLVFAGSVSWTPPVVTTWCSPGYWKNHPQSWPAGYLTLKYNSFSGVYAHDPKTFVGYDFGKKDGSNNPTLIEVISNPSIYGGPATNNVADILSNKVFGTPIGSGVESCPLN